MTIRKSRLLTALAFFVVLRSLSPHRVLADDEQKFELTGGAGSAIAVVQEETITFALDPGAVAGYEPKKTFNLTIGGCVVNVTGFVLDPDLLYNVKEMGAAEFTAINNPKSIVATKDTVTFKSANSVTLKCKVDFGEKRDDGFHVKVELSGEGVPKDLKLTSEAMLGKADDVNAAGLQPLHIALIVGGCVLLLILIALGVGGFFGYRYYKKKKLSKAQKVKDMQLKTAKSLEAVKAPVTATTPTTAGDAKTSEPASKTTEPISKTAEPKKAKGGKDEGKEKKKKEKKERSKESSGNKSDKSKSKKARTKESKGKKSEKEKSDRSKKSAKDTSKKDASAKSRNKPEDDPAYGVLPDEGH